MDLNNLDKYQEKKMVTKENLLKHIDSYEVYVRYLNINIKIGKVIISPFKRGDGKYEKNPSFGLFIKNKEVLFNDFTSGGGDFVVFVSKLFGLNNYYKALSKICIDFGLSQYYYCDKDVKQTGISLLKKINYAERQQETEKKLILIKRRRWEFHDLKYWGVYGISQFMLEKYDITPIESFSINNVNIKAGKYSYAFIERKDETVTYKIYQPFKKFKWLNNNDNSVLQGWKLLPSDDIYLIITKSIKDVMVIRSTLKIASIALQNELSNIKKEVMMDLSKRFDRIYLLLDNDFDKNRNIGQERAREFIEKNKEFDIKNILIPKKYKSKDISDLYRNYKREKTKKIFEKLLI